jgi:hypothetical protein
MMSGDSFHHLVHSDVLITSGSSFAYAAATFHKGIVINAIPKEGLLIKPLTKEGGHGGIYELSQHGQINSDGVITKPSLSQIHDQLFTQYVQKIKEKASRAKQCHTCKEMMMDNLGAAAIERAQTSSDTQPVQNQMLRVGTK